MPSVFAPSPAALFPVADFREDALRFGHAAGAGRTAGELAHVHADEPCAALAAECGFHDANSLSHLFSKRFGISMRDYRAQARAR